MSAELSAKITSKSQGCAMHRIHHKSESVMLRARSQNEGVAPRACPAEKNLLAVLQFGGVPVVYVVILLCAELGVGDATMWLTVVSFFTACVAAGIVAHELKS